MAIDPEEARRHIEGYSDQAENPYDLPPNYSSGGFSSTEDKLIIVIGFIMLAGLLTAAAWFLLS